MKKLFSLLLTLAMILGCSAMPPLVSLEASRGDQNLVTIYKNST